MKDVAIMKRKKPYRYSYKSTASRILAVIPNNITVFIPSPFEYNALNKYYLLSCRKLHPDLNIVCVDMGDRYMPITCKEIYMAYLGISSRLTFRKFMGEAMDINMILTIKGKNDKEYFMINPVFASNNNVNFNVISTIFTATSRFSGEIEIDDKYLTSKIEDIKKDSDKRMEM